MLSFFRMTKGILRKVDYYRSRFFWQNNEHKKKYRLEKWGLLNTPKCMRGLGITNLDTQNNCLLSKWLLMLMNEEGTWQKLLKRKYLQNKTLSQVTKQLADSQFWSGLMNVKDYFWARGKFEVKNGEKVRFWEDCWIGQKPLMQQYPELYNITRKKNQTVASVFSSLPLNISFRRALVGEKLEMWIKLVSEIMQVGLENTKDQFVWMVNKKGRLCQCIEI